MTYFAFLAGFLVLPIIVLGISVLRDELRGRALPIALQGWSSYKLIVVLVFVAVIYTTPWDNYLVATRVWWYDPALVTGITLGWVPLEEYVFFVLQTVFSGLWVLFLSRRISTVGEGDDVAPVRSIRTTATVFTGLIWVVAALMLIIGARSSTYLSLVLVWALPPIMLQLGFGADILWRYRGLVFIGILAPTIYLSAADMLAISSGTWTINPERSLDLLLFGALPVEEFIFFLVTNTLIVFGLVLGSAVESQRRIRSQTTIERV